VTLPEVRAVELLAGQGVWVGERFAVSIGVRGRGTCQGL
jgi:hypothetical protein